MPIYVRDQRGGNWFWIHNIILDQYGPQIGVYGLAVYVALCRHVNEEQATWVGQKAIARELGCSDRQVRREIDKLVDLHLLEVQERMDESGRTTNVYTLLPVTPVDSLSGGVDSPSGGSGQVVRTSGLVDRTWNKTQLTRSMEQDLSKGPPTGLDFPGPNGHVASTTPATSRKRAARAGAYLEAVMTDYSRELHDEEHTAANITRAARLHQASGLDERAFVEVVHAARTMTRARGNIRKAADGDPALRNRMPYFFAVLEDLLARAGEEPAEEPEGASAAGRGWTPEDAERYTSGPYGRLVQG